MMSTDASVQNQLPTISQCSVPSIIWIEVLQVTVAQHQQQPSKETSKSLDSSIICIEVVHVLPKVIAHTSQQPQNNNNSSVICLDNTLDDAEEWEEFDSVDSNSYIDVKMFDVSECESEQWSYSIISPSPSWSPAKSSNQSDLPAPKRKRRCQNQTSPSWSPAKPKKTKFF